MKIKLGKLQEAKGIFDKIFNEPMDIKLSYRLGKIARKINSELADIDKERIKLVEKYADPVEEGKPKQVKTNVREFIKDFTALLDTEEELDIQLIPLDLLLNSGIKISSNDMATIADFIEGEKSEVKDDKKA